MSELPKRAVVGKVRMLSIAATINKTSEKRGIFCFMKKCYSLIRIKSKEVFNIKNQIAKGVFLPRLPVRSHHRQGRHSYPI